MGILLLLYLCADKPSLQQLLTQNHCIQTVGFLIQSSVQLVELQLLSKALIARLIPIDTSDDTAVLILIKDDEVDHIIKMLTSAQSKHINLPIISIMMDLCRSPHNMWALASRDVSLLLSDVMDNISEGDQAKGAQLIWRMMEFNYNESEEVSALINNGTLLQGIHKGVLLEISDRLCLQFTDDQDSYLEVGTCQEIHQHDFLPYIVDCIKALNTSSKTVNYTVITKLSAALVLEFQLLVQCGDKFREEIARNITDSEETYTAIQAMTDIICNKGRHIMVMHECVTIAGSTALYVLVYCVYIKKIFLFFLRCKSNGKENS